MEMILTEEGKLPEEEENEDGNKNENADGEEKEKGESSPHQPIEEEAQQ